MSKKKKAPPKRTAAEKAEFKRELTEVVPHLRAFARGLCGRPDMAYFGFTKKMKLSGFVYVA